MRYLADTHDAEIDLDPEYTMLSLGGEKAAGSYGAPGVIADWLRFVAGRLGIDFYADTRWRGPSAMKNHVALLGFVEEA